MIKNGDSILSDRMLFSSSVINKNFIFIMLMYGDGRKHLKAIHLIKISGCLLAMLKGDAFAVPYRVQNHDILQTCFRQRS